MMPKLQQWFLSEVEAVLLLQEVLAVDDNLLEKPELEHAVCSDIWHFVSKAIDRDDKAAVARCE